MPEIERAELGVDGNSGFALLGDDLQSGEAEFCEIGEPGNIHSARSACSAALNQLRARLGKPNLSYYLGKSHPFYCP